MEIERKYLVNQVPADYMEFPCHAIEQAYLCTSPVVRIRKEEDSYYLTYKGKGLLSREEYNLPLNEAAYAHLLTKADGIVLTKRRYLIPFQEYTIELDVFEGAYKGLVLGEVEFASEQEALDFVPPDWFGEDVTFSGQFQNSRLSKEKAPF